MADPKNFVVKNDSLGLIVECTHPECRRNGSGHYARFGHTVTVAEVIAVMDAHDRLEGDHDNGAAARAAARTTLKLNEDELWLLYRLVLGEVSGGPCLLEQPHVEHETAAGTALAKLSDAVLAIQENNAKE
jgi:hypothetical protein